MLWSWSRPSNGCSAVNECRLFVFDKTVAMNVDVRTSYRDFFPGFVNPLSLLGELAGVLLLLLALSLLVELEKLPSRLLSEVVGL
jgi:hypothetical protein